MPKWMDSKISSLTARLERMIEPKSPEEASSTERMNLFLDTRFFGRRDVRTLKRRIEYAIALIKIEEYELAAKELVETLSLLGRSGLSRRQLRKRDRILEKGLRENELTRHAQRWYGEALYNLERFTESEMAWRAVVEQCQHDLGSDNSDTLDALEDHAAVLSKIGQFGEAEAELLSAISSRSMVSGSTDTATLRARYSYANVLLNADKYADAEEESRSLIEDCARVLGADHSRTLSAADTHADTMYFLGMLSESAQEFEILAERCERVFGSDHPRTQEAREGLDRAKRELQQEDHRNGRGGTHN